MGAKGKALKMLGRPLSGVKLRAMGCALRFPLLHYKSTLITIQLAREGDTGLTLLVTISLSDPIEYLDSWKDGPPGSKRGRFFSSKGTRLRMMRKEIKMCNRSVKNSAETDDQYSLVAREDERVIDSAVHCHHSLFKNGNVYALRIFRDSYSRLLFDNPHLQLETPL